MEDHVVVVTGGASGIGRELSLALSSMGLTGLVITDIDAVNLEVTRRDCQILLGSEVLSVVADLRDPAAIFKLHESVIDAFGRCSVLINNAGSVSLGRFTDEPKESFDRVMDINFVAVVNMCRTFLPSLMKETNSHIVNISSMYGYFVSDSCSSYHASKFAVRGFSEALYLELKNQVMVHVVHPGFSNTSLMKHSSNYSTESRENIDAMFKQVSCSTPSQVAQHVIQGILNDQQRILIGPDAILTDILVRAAPSLNLYLGRESFLVFLTVVAKIASKVRFLFLFSRHICVLIEMVI